MLVGLVWTALVCSRQIVLNVQDAHNWIIWALFSRWSYRSILHKGGLGVKRSSGSGKELMLEAMEHPVVMQMNVSCLVLWSN